MAHLVSFATASVERGPHRTHALCNRGPHRSYALEQPGDEPAVVNGLGLDRVVLVPHDASGPAAINWALDQPDWVTDQRGA